MEDGLVTATDEGTPQGSILSPLLSNIYLHYVLDLWFDKRVIPASQGEAYLFRFADGFVWQNARITRSRISGMEQARLWH